MEGKIDEKAKAMLRELSAEKDYLTIQKLMPLPLNHVTKIVQDLRPICLYYNGFKENNLLESNMRNQNSPKTFQELIYKLKSSIRPISYSRD